MASSTALRTFASDRHNEGGEVMNRAQHSRSTEQKLPEDPAGLVTDGTTATATPQALDHLDTPPVRTPGVRRVTAARGKMRRSLLAVVGAVAMVAIAFVAAAKPADAYTAPNGATWYQADVFCDQTTNRVRVEHNVYPQPGLSWQWVSFRIMMVDTWTGQAYGWTQWSDPFVVDRSPYNNSPLTSGSWFPDGQRRFYVQYRWWNGSWSYLPQGYVAKHWGAGLHMSGSVLQDRCYT
jgi:hypothetical protein